jgi:hypothetical protein
VVILKIIGMNLLNTTTEFASGRQRNRTFDWNWQFVEEPKKIPHRPSFESWEIEIPRTA